MRISGFLLLSIVALLFSTANARAQLDLPIADYTGALKLAVTCPDGTITKVKTKGTVSIDAQAGANILVSGEFVGKSAGIDCTVTLDMTGSVNTIGRVLGTYTSTIVCSDGTTTMGSGNFDGRYNPGRLAFLIEGLDDTCVLVGAFKGKGSPGTALCAALTHRAILKLAKKYYGGWSRFYRFANIGLSGAILQATVQKAQAGFAKASKKIAKKSTKAGGSCSKDPTPPAIVTNRLRNRTIVPMSVGFQKNRALDRFARSRMAKLQGQYFVARLKAESTFIMKLDPLKRTAALQNVRDAFVNKSTKLLTKVTKLGLDWMGPTAQGMATDIEDLTDFLVAFYE